MQTLSEVVAGVGGASGGGVGCLGLAGSGDGRGDSGGGVVGLGVPGRGNGDVGRLVAADEE